MSKDDMLVRQQDAEFMHNFGKGDVPGEVHLSSGLERIGGMALFQAVRALGLFNASKPEYELRGRPCGAIEFASVKIIWRLYHRDADYIHVAKDPADLVKSRRLLRLCLPDERLALRLGQSRAEG